MTKKEIKKRLYDYGLEVGYALSECEVADGFTRADFIKDGFCWSYQEGDTLPEAIFPDIDDDDFDYDVVYDYTDELYKGINKACQDYWGVKKVSSGDTCCDCTVVVEQV